MTIQWKQVTVALITGLLLGAFVVAGVLRFHGHDFSLRRQVQHFSRQLDLTPEQRDQLTVILENKREKLHDLNREIRPRFQEIRESTREEIRKILTPEQQKKFESMRAERRGRLGANDLRRR